MVYGLCVVDDADELVGGCRDDLLSRERPAATLDQGVGSIDLVCAVHVDDDGGCGVQIDDVYAMPFEPSGGGIGARYRGVELVLNVGQCIDEEVGGATSSNADDGIACQLRLDQVQCRAGDSLLRFVLAHRLRPLSLTAFENG